MTPVEDLKPGDLVDLENDPYADPFGARGEEEDPAGGEGESRHMSLECSYATVEGTEPEDPRCTVVYTDLASACFPNGHLVDVVGTETV
jgi:hypothetical protein